MCVAELIEILKTFPSTARVVVDGYEGDCDDIRAIKLQPIRAFANDDELTGCGMGKHVECSEDEATEVAVFIMRDGALR